MADDNLTSSTVQWHRCNDNLRPVQGDDGVGVAINPYAQTMISPAGRPPNQPFEHKSIPFREDVLHPVEIRPPIILPTGITTRDAFRSGSF